MFWMPGWNISMHELENNFWEKSFEAKFFTPEIFRHLTPLHDILVRFSAVLAAEILSDKVFIF